MQKPQSDEQSPQPDTQEFQSFMYKFQQQIMDAWRPVPHPSTNSLLYAVIFVVCLVVGLLLILTAPEDLSVNQRYDDVCPIGTSQCSMPINVNHNLNAPVHVYYQLNGFHQNHRKYLKFFSTSQLENGQQYQSIDEATQACGTGFVTNSDLGNTISTKKTLLEPKDIAFPCGTIAKAYSKLRPEIKSFKLLDPDGKEVTIRRTGITWKNDLGRHKDFNLEKQAFSVTEEDWLVWFRPAATNTVVKRLGVIEKSLAPGKYTLNFANILNSSFGSKKFVLEQVSFVGSRNMVLGISFLVLAVINLVLMCLFLAKWIQERRQKLA